MQKLRKHRKVRSFQHLRNLRKLRKIRNFRNSWNFRMILRERSSGKGRNQERPSGRTLQDLASFSSLSGDLLL